MQPVLAALEILTALNLDHDMHVSVAQLTKFVYFQVVFTSKRCNLVHKQPEILFNTISLLLEFGATLPTTQRVSKLTVEHIVVMVVFITLFHYANSDVSLLLQTA